MASAPPKVGPPNYPPGTKHGTKAVPIHSQPMLVRLATMIGPAKFWAMPLPERMRFETDEEMNQGPEEPIDKILKLERELGELYNTPCGEVQQKLNPEGSFFPDEIKEGILVAVRHNVYSKHWYRGRVITVMTKKNVILARMFLIDHGDFLAEVPVRSCLRKLPKRMQIFPRPLAFQVILAGLRPISWDINYEIGLKSLGKTYAPEWSVAATDMILAYYKKSKLKLGEITNWQKDANGRVHGSLELLGFTEKIVLNDILVKAQYAKYSAEILKSQLKSEKSGNISSRMSNLSICGVGTPDAVIMDNSDFSGEYDRNSSFSSSSSNVAAYGDRTLSNVAESIFDETMFCPEEYEDVVNPLKPLDPNTIERARRRQKSRSSLNASISNPPSTTSTNIASKNQKVSQSSDSGSARSIWDEIREQDSSEESEEDALDEDLEQKEERRKLRRETKKKNAQIILRIPAGVDTGKFLEEQLKRGKNSICDGLGPKRIPNPNVKSDVPSSSQSMDDEW